MPREQEECKDLLETVGNRPMFWKNWKKHLCGSLVACLLPAATLAAPIREDNPEVGKKLNLPIYSWRDPDQRQKGILVAVHGLTFYAQAFEDFARYIAAQGYTFYAADMRGFGRWKTDSAQFNGDSKIHFSQTKEDLLRLTDTLRRENPDAKIYALGESLGANFAIWLASSKPELVNGVIVSGPCYKRWLHPRVRWTKDFVTTFWRPEQEMNLEPYINPYLSTDRKLTTECLRDPMIMRKMSPVDLFKTDITNRETLQYVGNLPEKMPMLIIAGEKDAVFKSKFIPELVGFMGTKRTEVNILEGKGHLLLEHQSVKPDIAELVGDWLSTNTRRLLIDDDAIVQAPPMQ
jgi:alpha-beta hydrolase superfamily lysophospholipase